jgi:hypothetical protein
MRSRSATAGIPFRRTVEPWASRIAFEHDDGTVSVKTDVFGNCVLGGRVDPSVGFHCDSGIGGARYDDIRVDWQ